MELAFRESLKKMRGTKSKEKFSQELEMSRSNYSLIESGTSRVANRRREAMIVVNIFNEIVAYFF